MDFSNNRPPFKPPMVHTFIKWNSDQNNEYIQSLRSHQDSLFLLVNDISSVDDMNSAVRKITDILYDCAFDIFGRTVLIRDNNNSERPNNEWFNEKCEKARQHFHKARNFFQRHPTDINKLSYVVARNSFNKIKRQAQYTFKRRKGMELCNIAKTDPRKFCSALKHKSKENV